MKQLVTLLLLVVLAGCSRQPPEPPATAMSHAATLRDEGDFRGAAAVLANALTASGLSDSQRKDLLFQKDILRRIKLDYPLTRNELYDQLSESVQDLTPEEFNQWINQGRFDDKLIDGKMRFVSVSRSNLYFRYPELRRRKMEADDDVSEQKGRLLDALTIKKAALAQKTPYVLPHYFLCTMTVTVADDVVPPSKIGKLLRAWLPIPRYYPYQNDFKLISSSTPPVKIAPETSLIRSAYFEQHTSRNSATKFVITYSYKRSGVYFDMDPALVQSPDLQEPELKKYTSEAPHVVFTEKIKEQAGKIAGSETNSYRVAKAFYDWIGGNVKYSYAREYSTLGNISDYCLTNRYGDCGQEAMLFITLCRSHGIPARWQTGWDLFPGYHDIHDWTEIYLAPYGWVPVDPWAGMFATRYCTSLTPEQRRELHDFYFGGLDYYRMAANGDHSQQLDPPKQSLRSDDLDFQRGEVELGERNIYFDKYSYHMQVQEFGCPPFAAEQFKDFSGLANKIALQSDPVSAFLWRMLSPDEQLQVANHESTEPALKSARNLILKTLNQVVEIGEPGIYDSQRFQNVSLRPETIELVKQKPTGANLSRLNRLLIEDAYPAELSKPPTQ